MINVTFDAEIAKDPKFDIQLSEVIEEIKAERRKAIEKYGANKLKATPIGRMIDAGELTVEFLKAEFPKVANKQSSLSSAKRDIVGQLVFNAAQRTVLLKQAERARKIEEKANARVEAEENGTAQEPAAPKPKGSKRKAKKLSKKGK